MSNRSLIKRFHGLTLLAAAVSLLSARCAFSQEEQAPSGIDRSPDSSHKMGKQGGSDIRFATLPDAPVPKTERAPQEPDPASAQKSLNALPVLPPRVTRGGSLTLDDKFRVYVHQTFCPSALALPAFGAGFQMLNPKSNYPRDWKDGPQAFGNLYGDKLAMITSRRTARFLADAALHEDPRYVSSTSKNVFARTFHALAFTVVDKTDSGRNTLALGNFAGAAAGGFVGMAYLPRGYNDVTHAQQRVLGELATIAIGNIAAEYYPQWGPIYKKLHIPKILPSWWVPPHNNTPNHP